MEKLILETESLVNEGNASEAAKRLKRIVLNKVPRRFLFPLASVMRRSGLFDLGARLLNPIVRGKAENALPAERALYAAILVKLGATEEAERILADVDVEAFPEATLYRVHALMSRWNYADCLSLLAGYLKRKDLTPLQRLVGKLNLAAAYVYEHFHVEAETLLDELRQETHNPELFHFYGNVMEISAQLAVDREAWAEARRCLLEAHRVLRKAGTLDEFFVFKWNIIVDLLEEGPDPKRLLALNQLAKEAVERKHWETLRHCDLLRAKLTRDPGLIVHLYYGTPFESFRSRIFKEIDGEVTIPESYDWKLGKGKTSPQTHETALHEKSGLPERLLAALVVDFYRPARVAELHTRLYPDQYFNPESSPLQVHQAVRLLRDWLKTAKFPLKITHGDGYVLGATAPCVLRIARSRSSESTSLEKLQKAFSDDFFSAAQAGEALDLPKRSVSRVLKEAVEEGKLVRLGSGNATTYSFKVNPVPERRKSSASGTGG